MKYSVFIMVRGDFRGREIGLASGKCTRSHCCRDVMNRVVGEDKKRKPIHCDTRAV